LQKVSSLSRSPERKTGIKFYEKAYFLRGDIMQLFGLGIAAGLGGTALGTALGLLLPAASCGVMGCLLNFTGGLMLAVVCFELLPEAILISQPTAVLGVIAGAVMMLGMEREKSGSGLRTPGLMLCLGVALHNLPEGLAVGAGFRDAPILGLTLAGCIMAHDLPEGLAMAAACKHSGMPRLKIAVMAVLAGLPGVMGTWAGYWAGGLAPGVMAFCLALAAGAMLQIICRHLLPQANSQSAAPWVTVFLSAGVMGGALLTHWI